MRYYKEYDIFVPELNIGIEVKSDEKSKYTSNIVIEIEFNNKPSALSTSRLLNTGLYMMVYEV